MFYNSEVYWQCDGALISDPSLIVVCLVLEVCCRFPENTITTPLRLSILSPVTLSHHLIGPP